MRAFIPEHRSISDFGLWPALRGTLHGRLPCRVFLSFDDERRTTALASAAMGQHPGATTWAAIPCTNVSPV